MLNTIRANAATDTRLAVFGPAVPGSREWGRVVDEQNKLNSELNRKNIFIRSGLIEDWSN